MPPICLSCKARTIMKKKYLVGFDPGGEDNFGWCVIEDRDQTPVNVVRVGIAVHAAEAVEAAYKVVQDPADVIGVGIDAPLYLSLIHI